MEGLLPMVAGVAVGLAAVAPMALALRSMTGTGRPMSTGAALACGFVPFLLLQGLLVIVWFLWPQAAFSFGAFAAFSFLVAVTAAALIAWRRMG